MGGPAQALSACDLPGNLGGALEGSVGQPLERLDDLLVGAVAPGVLDEGVAIGRVVDAVEVLLSLDEIGIVCHDRACPRGRALNVVRRHSRFPHAWRTPGTRSSGGM